MRIWSLRPIVALSAGLIALTAQALDVDSGHDAIGLAKVLGSSELGAGSAELSGGWVRLRGIDLSKVLETREALLKLRAQGIKTCVFLRRSVKDWKVSYLPADLSEAYEHGRKLGVTYGDLVDAWEVDNEPDLGFVPESAERYTAFLKAMYLGIKAGSREQGAGSLNNPQVSLSAVGQAKAEGFSRAPLVIMGSLGLPPGPWMERFAANDGFAYTDGFNYHYYGYADDFSGVYQQHEAALRELGAGSLERGDPGPGHETNQSGSLLPAPRSTQKNLPVFLTEIGYGMLGKSARDTKEGRLRQWRWFKSVGEQVATLRPEAPMAFYLPPYLEYDTSEYGLTVPAKQETEKAEGGKLKAEEWIAGGIKYSPGDFGAEKAEPWMENIGKELGGNQVTPALAQWRAARNPSGFRFQVSGFSAGGSRSWSVTTAPPSPVVLDFLPGEGLSHVKRYNGLFVTGREPPVHKKPETGNLKPEVLPTKPLPPTPSPSAPTRSEELILQIRTQNGNLYEVYPTRQATPEWQRFLEPGDNFTMAFYGRAAPPWRFKDNKPASLVVVMYPKQLPATYEFRRPQLLKLGAGSPEHGARPNNQEPITSYRYGAGTVVLYNFSDKPVTGRLELPDSLAFTPITDNSQPITPGTLTLAPNERREIPVSIKVPWDRYERIPVEIRFASDGQLSVGGDSLSGSGPNNLQSVTNNPSETVSRFRTDLIPDIGGMPATLVAELFAPRTDGRQLASDGRGPTTDNRGQTTENGRQPNNQEPSTNNRSRIATRPRASEEAPMVEQIEKSVSGLRSQLSGFQPFVQPGATVERTTHGFAITVTSIPAGRSQRIEVEIPWPDGLEFPEDGFLSVEFRLR